MIALVCLKKMFLRFIFERERETEHKSGRAETERETDRQTDRI